MNNPIEITLKDVIINDDKSNSNLCHIVRYVSDDKRSLKIPKILDGKRVVSLAENSFYRSNPWYIELPEGLEAIHKNAFKSSELRQINIPSTVHYIGTEAFRFNIKLRDVKFNKFNDDACFNQYYFCEEKEKEIDKLLCEYYDYIDYNKIKFGIIFGSGVFDTCVKLTSINLPINRITYVSEKMFKKCLYLENIILPNSIYYVFKQAFEQSGVKEIILSKNITDIESYAFYKCKKLRQIILPEYLIVLKDNTFKDCKNLRSIIFNDFLEYVGNHALHNTKVNKINIPKSLKTLSPTAFSKCRDLNVINVNKDSKRYMIFDNTLYFKDDNDKLIEIYILPRG